MAEAEETGWNWCVYEVGDGKRNMLAGPDLEIVYDFDDVDRDKTDALMTAIAAELNNGPLGQKVMKLFKEIEDRRKAEEESGAGDH